MCSRLKKKKKNAILYILHIYNLPKQYKFASGFEYKVNIGNNIGQAWDTASRSVLVELFLLYLGLVLFRSEERRVGKEC